MLEDVGMKSHGDVRRSRKVAVVGARQGRTARWEDDVVAVAPKAGESSVGAVPFGTCERVQPGAVELHLVAVPGHGVTREPGSTMRGGDRDDAVVAPGLFRAREPGTNGQPAHAVRHQHWRKIRG